VFGGVVIGWAVVSVSGMAGSCCSGVGVVSGEWGMLVWALFPLRAWPVWRPVELATPEASPEVRAPPLTLNPWPWLAL
jgi:hypothetical protein